MTKTYLMVQNIEASSYFQTEWDISDSALTVLVQTVKKLEQKLFGIPLPHHIQDNLRCLYYCHHCGVSDIFFFFKRIKICFNVYLAKKSILYSAYDCYIVCPCCCQ